MQKKSRPLKVILRLMHILLLICIVALCIYIMRFNDIFNEGLKEGWYSELMTNWAKDTVEEKYAQYGIYTSDAILKMASIYGIFFIAILTLLASVDSFIKVFCLEKGKNKETNFFYQIATIFLFVAIAIMFYTILPFFHNFESITKVVDREVKGPDQVIVDTEYVYEKVEVMPSFPFDISGSEAVVIDASYGMKEFMTKFYEENVPFFVQEDRKIFILRDGKLELFDGDFSKITYSGNSSNIAEILHDINFDTIWLFSDEVGSVEPQSTGKSIQDKSIIIYSPTEIDVDNLETYFSVVNGIAVMNIK